MRNSTDAKAKSKGNFVSFLAGLNPRYVVAGALVLATFVWACWGAVRELFVYLYNNDNYSSGMLVPLLVLYVIYLRRDELRQVSLKPALFGFFAIILAFGMRFAGAFLGFGSLERISIVAALYGTVLTLCGWRLVWRLKWELAFLLMMLPWPYRVHMKVSLPLQGYATSSSVFLLELFGWFVARQGNVIDLGGTKVAVAEACSGLRMMTAFMIVSVLVVFMAKRRWWQNVIIILSSIPIAIGCNTIRLTLTAIAFTHGYGPKVNKLFHDFGGIAMMPFALAMLALELWVLAKLFVTSGPVVGERLVGQGDVPREEAPVDGEPL